MRRGRGTTAGTTGRRIGAVVTALALAGSWLALALPAEAAIGTISGGGAEWLVADQVGTSNGAPTGGIGGECPGSAGAGVFDAGIINTGFGDAFDGGAMLWVGGSQVGGALSVSGQTASFSPTTVAGLTRSLSYEALSTAPVLRVLLTLQNTTGSPVTVPVDYATNFGSDFETQVIATSSGDTTFTTADRWIVTDDNSTTFGDPANTTVLGGPGSPSSPPTSVSQTVFQCAGTQGVLATYSVTVPAGEQRSLLFFQRIDTTAANAQAAAPSFDTANPADPIFAGLTSAQLATIVNWSFAAPDTTPPTCFISALRAGPPKQMDVTVQDTGSGLAEINRITVVNGSVSVQPFTPGTTAPVVVTATKADPAQPTRWNFWAVDMAGNERFCDPIDLDLRRTGGRPEVVTADDVPGTAHLLTVRNATPGITTLKVEVNGVRVGNLHLGDGEARTLDIAAHLRSGDDNTVTLTASGRPDGSAAVIIHN